MQGYVYDFYIHTYTCTWIYIHRYIDIYIYPEERCGFEKGKNINIRPLFFSSDVHEVLFVYLSEDQIVWKY